MQCLTVGSYEATGGAQRTGDNGMVLNKTVWVLNNFFEILSEQFIIIIRKGQVPIEVGQACQSSMALTDTVETVLIVFKVKDIYSPSWAKKAV